KQDNKFLTAGRKGLMVVGVGLATMPMAFADTATVDVDLTTGLAGVAVIGGLVASGTLKALPTYASWGIKKALSMLR
ncbi:hypothetical protein, partial [Acinetobacter sp. ANC 4635]